ncbi:hypothetical protein PybrP1_004223 [[Pythium] brassicae (nom. inval.)]|nr:hypothetical protein PybrP1_004223 [[Pythium] brassicae (nom. inval.)]
MATATTTALTVVQCVAKRRRQLERLEFVLGATALRLLLTALTEEQEKQPEARELFTSALLLEDFADMMPRLLELREEEEHVVQRTERVWRAVRDCRNDSSSSAPGEILTQCALKWAALVAGAAYLRDVIARTLASMRPCVVVNHRLARMLIGGDTLGGAGSYEQEQRSPGSGSLTLDAQRMGIASYVHAASFPAAVVNLAGNPLRAADLSSADAVLTQIILSSCSLSSLSGLAFPQQINTSSSWNLTLDLGDNNLDTIQSSALPARLRALSLANNALPGLINASLPNSLERLDLASNVITRIETTELPAGLRFLDLRGNPLQSVELRETDALIAERCTILPPLIQASCSDKNAALRVINGHRICVIPDSLFEQKKYGGLLSSGAPETAVVTPASSHSASAMSVALGVLYVTIGVVALVAAVLIWKRVRSQRRAGQEPEQLSEYVDGSGFTPLTATTPRRVDSFARNGNGSRQSQRSSRQVPRFQPQSPRGFLGPLLRVLSGVRRESDPLAKASTAHDGSSGKQSMDMSSHAVGPLDKFRLVDECVQLGELVLKGTCFQYLATVHEADKGERRALASRLAPGVAACDPHQVQVFVDEIARSASLAHPKIVSFLGFCQIDGTPYALMEQPPNSNLESFLAVRPLVRQEFQWLARGKWPKSKVEIALDIVDALVHLHSLAAKIHVRDLRARQVWLTADFTAKLVCFGNDPRFPSPQSETRKRLESFGGVASSPTASASASCGTGSGVSCPRENSHVATLVSSGSIRPALAADCPVPIRELILQCLSFAPTDRPSTLEIQSALRKVVARSRLPYAAKAAVASACEVA